MSVSVDSKDFSNKSEHCVNWYVHRDRGIRKDLTSLWNNGSGITNKKTLEGSSVEQRIFKTTNVLFKNMENLGPVRPESLKYKYDNKNDFHHVHVSKGRLTYLVMWEADEKKRIINIVSMGPHENYDFTRKHDKKTVMKKIDLLRESDNKYLENCEFNRRRENLMSGAERTGRKSSNRLRKK